MNGTVPSLSIVFMAISCLIGFALPVALLLYFRIRKKADILPFFTGCAVMLIFALILEAAVHRIILSSSAGAVIQGNIWLYALYGGMMAGLFEETGRFLAFKTVLKRRQNNNINALMYGAGHGGFEAVVVLGIAMVNNIIWSVLINSGNTGLLTGTVSGELLTQVEDSIQQLVSTEPWMFLLGGIERIFAVILQIALSVLVWFAAKNRKRLLLYPAAILIHFAVDAVTVLLSGMGVSTIALETVIGALAVLTAVLAKSVWNREKRENN